MCLRDTDKVGRQAKVKDQEMQTGSHWLIHLQ